MANKKVVEMMEDDDDSPPPPPPEYVQLIQKTIRDLSDDAVQPDLVPTATKGVRLLKAHKGFLLCSFIVHHSVSDENGNWHAGAMATLIDIISSWAIYSVAPSVNVSVDFSISFYSTAKVQEEVELEAKVLGQKGKLTSVVVEVRNKQSGQRIALGKQWMSQTNTTTSSKL